MVVYLGTRCGILITSEKIPGFLVLPSARTKLYCTRPAATVLACVCVYLLHGRVANNQLLPQVSDVMVEPLHVLLKVVPERQQRLLHFTLELLNPNKANS